MIAVMALTVASFALCMLTLWGMSRLRRGQMLRTIAAFMRRQIPLESALEKISRSRGESREEILAAKISRELARGSPLPVALLRAKILTAQQAVVLQHSQSRGVETVLGEFAEQALRLERGLALTIARVIYPLTVGGAVLFIAAFLQMSIVPLFQQLMREMEMLADGSLALESRFALGTTLIAGSFVWGAIGASLQAGWIGTFIWWHVPFFGSHLRAFEQARLARSLGQMLDAGVPLETALDELIRGRGCGWLNVKICRVLAELQSGEAPPAAFKSAGGWRAEFIWAVESLSAGAPPRATFNQVAEVIEDKARHRMRSFERVWFTISVFLCGMGVGLIGWTIYGSMIKLAEALLQW